MALTLLLPLLLSRPVLVTVDDLPIATKELHETASDREAVTRGLLAALARHKITAVGFVVGKNHPTPEDERLLDLWLKGGHELGNHSFSHLDYTGEEKAAYIADVERERVWLDRFLKERGKALRFFRYPFLNEGDTLDKLRSMRDYLKESGQTPLPVTIDNQDWSFERPYVGAQSARDTPGLETVSGDYLAALRLHVAHFENVSEKLFSREVPEILLLHANAVGAANWDALFTWLEATHHRFATVDEVLADPALKTPYEYAGENGFSLWDRIRVERRGTAFAEEIRNLVSAQVATWNKGDIEAFVSYYAENCTFVAPGSIHKGRAAVLERYRKRYPDRAAMGTLAIDVDEIRPLWGDEVSLFGDSVPGSITTVSVVGRWHLTYPQKPEASGETAILLKRRGGTWEIVQDASM